MNSKQALQTFGRSGNPMFSDKTFSETIIDAKIERMTLQGTVNKVGISLLLVMLSASYTWNQYFEYGPAAISTFMIGGSIVGLIFALITIFKRTWAPITAPIYALAKGFALGGISAKIFSALSGVAPRVASFSTITSKIFVHVSLKIFCSQFRCN